VQYGYPVLQPETVSADAFHRQMAELAPDLFIVVAFGQILPQSLLDIPGIGAINVHASLLPRYRGAAPIQWAIINGDRETGVTTMMMDKGMDTGDMLLMEKTDIGPDETAADLHDRLSEMGARTLVRTLEKLQNGSLERTPQDHAQATYAPMLKKKDGKIDWSMPAERIECLIRGVTPWPGAYTFSDDMRLKIFKASVLEREISVPPGTILECFSGELRVATGQSAIAIQEIQGNRANACPSTIFSAAAACLMGRVWADRAVATSPNTQPVQPIKPKTGPSPTPGPLPWPCWIAWTGARRPWTPFSMMPHPC
jgi:methionyl-tRNA formyltransferase